MLWIESQKSLQLGELVEVPGWHCHPLSPYPVHRPTYGGAHLTEAESSRAGVVTGRVGVHRPVLGGASPWAPLPLSGATASFHSRLAELELGAEGALPWSPPW